MQSQNLTISGSNPTSELSSETQHSTADNVGSQSQVPSQTQSDSWSSNSQGLTQTSGAQGNLNQVSEPELTDEHAVRLAQERYGQNFTPSAARAFLTYREDSDAIQTCEFYRFRDEHFDKWGYF